MNRKATGSYYERRAIRTLEALGYHCTKAGGSLGVFDIVAIGSQDVKAIQVKGGDRPYLRPLEREAMELIQTPPSVSKEYWAYKKHARLPIVEIL